MYQDGSFKSINEKLFKMELEANDDNREIAETTEDTQVSDDLMVLLERFRNDIVDKVQEFDDHYSVKSRDRKIQGKGQKPEKISIFLNIADQLVNALKKAEFNNFGKSVLQSITTLLNEIKAQYGLLQGKVELINILADDLRREKYQVARQENPNATATQLENVRERIFNQMEENLDEFNERVGLNVIESKIEEIISLLEVKLTNYNQNVVNAPIEDVEEEVEDEVSGSGRARKNMFLNLGPYQNKQKLIV